MWLFVGVNGVGKTTTIGKLAAARDASGARGRARGRGHVPGRGRRAARDLGGACRRRIVRGADGADPSSVIFDAVQHAAARGAGLVLADTAGRLHTKVNLMEELRKVRRVAERPPGQLTEVLLVLDATTGQNGLVQARQFTEAVGVTGHRAHQARRHGQGRHRARDPIRARPADQARRARRGRGGPGAVRPGRVRRRPLRLTSADPVAAAPMPSVAARVTWSGPCSTR